MDSLKKYLTLAFTTLMSVVGYVTSSPSSSPSTSPPMQNHLQTDRRAQQPQEGSQERTGYRHCHWTHPLQHHRQFQRCARFGDRLQPALRASLQKTVLSLHKCGNPADGLLQPRDQLPRDPLRRHNLRLLLYDYAGPDQSNRNRQKYRCFHAGCLSKNGRIYFLLTLYEEKNTFNKIMEYVKPMLKYLSTIDFGQVTYRSDF